MVVMVLDKVRFINVTSRLSRDLVGIGLFCLRTWDDFLYSILARLLLNETTVGLSVVRRVW